MERPNSVYVSWQVHKALRLLAKTRKFDRADRSTGEVIKATADLIADEWLHDRLNSDYPQIFIHQKEIEQKEKELIKSL